MCQEVLAKSGMGMTVQVLGWQCMGGGVTVQGWGESIGMRVNVQG